MQVEIPRLSGIVGETADKFIQDKNRIRCPVNRTEFPDFPECPQFVVAAVYGA
jgi:hypothetical protein